MSLTGLKESERTKYNEWYGLMIKEKDAIAERVENNIPSERQSEAHLDWNDILKIRDDLKIGSIDHVLVGMYTFIPPRRVKDYATMRVYNDITYTPVRNHNYIHLNNSSMGPHMYVHEFKTVKTMNPYFTTELPKALLETISVSLRSEPRQYLFCQGTGEPFKNELTFSSFVNRRLKDIFKNSKFTVTSFRHSYATHKEYNKAERTLRDRVKGARAMGHGLHKHLSYAYASSSLNPVISDPVPKDDILCYEKDKSSGKMKAINCMELTRRLQARAKQLKAAKSKGTAKHR
jgi:integrase